MIPDTRNSLIMRLGQTSNVEVWSEFVAAYQPVIQWAAKKQGLQSADVDDVVQQVLTSISVALKRRPHDPERARFRTWLYRVTHNAILNSIHRQKPDRAQGGDTSLGVLAAIETPADYLDQYDNEYERAAFLWAATKIRPEFQAQTWHAFWLSMVEGKSTDEVASLVGEKFCRPFSVGSVYAAKSRVLKRLREKVGEFDESCQIP